MYILKNEVVESGRNNVYKWMGGSEKIQKDMQMLEPICVERGALTNEANTATEDDSALDQQWKCRHYLIIPYRLSEWHFDAPCQLIKCKKHSLKMKCKK